MFTEKVRPSKPIPADERRIDQAIEDTFPASDPPATTGGITKIHPPQNQSDEDEETDSEAVDKTAP